MTEEDKIRHKALNHNKYFSSIQHRKPGQKGRKASSDSMPISQEHFTAEEKEILFNAQGVIVNERLRNHI